MSTQSTDQTPTTAQEDAGSPQSGEPKPEAPEGHEPSENPSEPDSGEPETFTRAYVEELRNEAAKHRVNAKKSDELSQRLVTAYADATGRLHDSRDLAYSEELLGDDGFPDPAKVHTAVEALIKDRPHLAKIRPVGDVGQNVTTTTGSAGLAAFGDLLRDAAS